MGVKSIILNPGVKSPSPETRTLHVPECGIAGAEADGALVFLGEVDEARVAPLRLGVLEHLLAVLQQNEQISTELVGEYGTVPDNMTTLKMPGVSHFLI